MMDQQEAGKTITVFSPRALRVSRMLTAAPHPAQARWPWPRFSERGISLFFIQLSSSYFLRPNHKISSSGRGCTTVYWIASSMSSGVMSLPPNPEMKPKTWGLSSLEYKEALSS